jgi:hypothetical protein
MSTQPSRFLALPAELRLMIYEQIDVTTRRHGLIAPEYVEVKHTTLEWHSIPTALLATCQQIKNEAQKHFDKY